MTAVAALTDFQPALFSAELIRLRTDANLSQRRLGDLSDVSNTAISALEAGTAPAPHPSMLMKLAHGLAKSGSGVVDEQRADDRYFTLMRAAGYVPEPQDRTADEQFRQRLVTALGPDNAALMELLFIKLRGRSSTTQKTALTVAETLLNSLPG